VHKIIHVQYLKTEHRGLIVVHEVIHVQYLKTEHRGLIVVHKVIHVQYLKTEHTVNEGSSYMQDHLISMLI
jgi:hypothetical protein